MDEDILKCCIAAGVSDVFISFEDDGTLLATDGEGKKFRITVTEVAEEDGDGQEISPEEARIRYYESKADIEREEA